MNRPGQFTPARPHDSIVFDREGALERIAGDPTLLSEIAEIFLNDGPLLLKDLQAALASGDLPGAERGAHALKGIAANVGGLRVERTALAVEDAARAGHSALAGIAAEQLVREFERLVVSLQNSVLRPSGADSN